MQAEVRPCLLLPELQDRRRGQEAGNPVNYSLHVRRGDGGLLSWCLPVESLLLRLQPCVLLRNCQSLIYIPIIPEAIIRPKHQGYRGLLAS